MIQFNLLPDVKVQLIRAQRLKRMMYLAALGTIGVSVGFLILMFSVVAVQNQHLSNLDKDIKSIRGELESNPDLARILSVQNQLETLPGLYDGRPAADRLPAYLDQTTPSNISISNLTIDFAAYTLEIRGQAASLEAVNSYVDTLKFTTFKVVMPEEEATDATNAFSGVVLTSFAKDDKETTFSINLTYDPLIFDGAKQVEFTVPSLATTRLQLPGVDLFSAPAAPEVQQ